MLNAGSKMSSLRAKLVAPLCMAFTSLAGPIYAASFTVSPTADATSWAISGTTAGAIPIESQYGGGSGNYTVVFSFAHPLTSVSHATVISGIGSVTSSTIDGSDPTKYIVKVTGVTDAQYLTITLTGVSGSGTSSTVSGSVGILIGDTNEDGFVDAVDTSQTKSQSGMPVTSVNFREDVNGDGFVDAVDVSLVKAMSGTTLSSFPRSPVGPPSSVPDSGSSVILFALSSIVIILAKYGILIRHSGE
jgi:hypothetical protein